MPELKSKAAGYIEIPQVQVVILTLLAMLCYSNTFHVPFLLDDQTSIVDNQVVHDLANFYSNRSGYSDHPNRFIGYLTFAVNYHYGQLEVASYHAVNLAIHVVNGLLVYSLLKLTLRTPHLTGTRSGLQGAGRFLPFVAALLFVVHPVQTQAVTYIVQRLASLATMFYLAAVVGYVRWRLARATGSAFLSKPALPFWIISLAAAVLAMKTKEISFTLPLVILLYELSFFGRPSARQLLELAPVLLTIFIIPLSSIDLLHPSAEFMSQVNAATSASATLSRSEYLCTEFSVIVTYLRLLVLPINQNLDYDYPVNRSLFEPRAFLSLLALLSLFGYALYLYRRSSPRSRSAESSAPGVLDGGLARFAGFGIIWFFLTLSVESSIVPIRDVIFEHRVYLPSVGFLTAAVALLLAGADRVANSSPAIGRLALPVLGGVALVMGSATYARNHVWRDWPTIWQDVKDKSPNKSTAYNQFGVYYGRQRRIPEAIREFQTAIRLDPNCIDPLYNLALTYIWIGRYQEAKEASKAIRMIDPELHKTLKQLHIPQLR